MLSKNSVKNFFFSPCFVFPKVNTYIHSLEELVNKWKHISASFILGQPVLSEGHVGGPFLQEGEVNKKKEKKKEMHHRSKIRKFKNEK